MFTGFNYLRLPVTGRNRGFKNTNQKGETTRSLETLDTASHSLTSVWELEFPGTSVGGIQVAAVKALNR